MSKLQKSGKWFHIMEFEKDAKQDNEKPASTCGGGCGSCGSCGSGP